MRRRPHQIAQILEYINLQPLNLLERQPGVLTLHDQLQHRTDYVVVIPEVRKWLPVELSLERRALFFGAVKNLSCFANLSFAQTIDGVKMQRNIIWHLTNEVWTKPFGK